MAPPANGIGFFDCWVMDWSRLLLFGEFSSVALGDHHVPDSGPLAVTVGAGEQHIVDERLVVVDALRVEPEVRLTVR